MSVVTSLDAATAAETKQGPKDEHSERDCHNAIGRKGYAHILAALQSVNTDAGILWLILTQQVVLNVISIV